MDDTIRTALERARDQWNEGRLDGYLELYADDVQVHGYGPGPLDRAGVEAFYASVWSAFDDARLEFHEMFAEGERVAVRFTMTGVHRGDFMGVPPTGTSVALDGITILHFRDGRCVERWASSDMLGLLVQLGAVPAPA